MIKMTPVLPLLVIIFLEGYVVLSSELLAMRLLLPFTGSGTDTVCIIIAAVLMPLAFGYYYGGRFKSRGRQNGGRRTVREKLIFNLVTAALILTPGLSHIFLERAFEFAYFTLNITNRIWLTILYSAIFLVVPVFLLGQTVPLISNYFSRQHMPTAAGKILFFSTMGSFMGAVFCTLVLMAFIGVHHTVTVTIACITILTFMLSKKWLSPAIVLSVVALALSLGLNSTYAMDKINVVSNNKFNLAQIEEYPEINTRVLRLNRTYGAGVYMDNKNPRFGYVEYIDQRFIAPLMTYGGAPRDILILGAGGFTMGRTDTYNNYTFVDIDKDLKTAAEEHLLREKLSPNKEFIAMEARAFLNQTDKKYDLIVLDLYQDPVSAPESLITREFFLEVRSHLKDGGIVAGNYFASSTLSDDFSVKLDNTIRGVFPASNRVPMRPYDGWKNGDDWDNIVYSYIHRPDLPTAIYTDNKNASMYDRPVMLHAPPSKR